MLNDDIKIYSVISTFTDLGMEVFHDPQIPNLTYHDLLNIANYYSVILNIGESSGGFYGPLPVAYRTDFLLYLFTFEMKNLSVTDSRAVENDNIVPAFLLIFFPTSVESLASRSRDRLLKELTQWKSLYKSIDEVSKEDMNRLSLSISALMLKEQSVFEMSEIEEANVVIGKSVELLHNVAQYQEKPVKLLVVGSDCLIHTLARTAIFEKNSSLVTYFKADNGVMDAELQSISLKIIQRTNVPSSVQKYVSNDLDGVLYFGNFSNKELAEHDTNELSKIIKNTNDNCAISFAISQSREPVEIRNTGIPKVLQQGVGRSISLIDLARPDMTISLSLIEFLEKITENMKR